MASYGTSKLLQSLIRSPELAQRLRENREAVYDEYGIPEAERKALRYGAPPDMGGIGVHPILQVHYMFFNDPNGFGKLANVSSYADKIRSL